MNTTEGSTTGHVQIEASAGDGLELRLSHRNANIYIEHPERSPLSESEPHVSVRVVTNDSEVTLGLDGPELDAVLDALRHAQDYHRSEGADD